MAAAAPAGPSIPSAVGSQFFGSGNSSASNISSGASVLSSNVTQFREIHKNSWLKRLTPEGKKITVGHKKSERSWVVFCVHDDCEPMLEGYAEPRHAASHTPEWVISIQDTLHISHALIPNSHEFEFVITLSNGVLRFHASSWEMMQEWVETLRSKLREMKILSPRENIYTKLPEVRAPLLPTRDPTSPLPAPPPVPAAFVPGVEPVVPLRATRELNLNTTEASASGDEQIENERRNSTSEENEINASTSSIQAIDPSTSSIVENSVVKLQESNGPMNLSMSNTLPQNLINMLSDPITAYSDQINKELNESDASEEDDDNDHRLGLSTLQLENLDDLNLMKDISQNDETEMDIEMRIKVDTVSNDVESFERPTTTDSLIPRPRTSSTHLLAFDCDEIPKRQLSKVLSCPEGTPSVDIPEKLTIDPTANITIIQVSPCDSKDIKKDAIKSKHTNSPVLLRKSTAQHQEQHKSNIEINPSSSENTNTNVTVQTSQSNKVIATTTSAASNNQYSTPIRNIPTKSIVSCIPTSSTHNSNPQCNTVTKVPIGGDVMPSIASETSIYSKCFLSTSTPSTSAQGLSKKIILSANSSGITNIEVHNSNDSMTSEDNLKSIHKLASSSNPDMDAKSTTATTATASTTAATGNNRYCEKVFLSSNPSIIESMAVPSTSSTAVKFLTKITPADANAKSRSSSQKDDTTTNTKVVSVVSTSTSTTSVTNSPQSKKINISTPTHQHKHTSSTSISNVTSASESSNMLPMRSRLLMRGLTEAVISTRPSRKDIHLLKSAAVATKTKSHSCHNNNKNQLLNNINHNNNVNNSNNNSNGENSPANRNTSLVDQRRRSSSTSDVQIQRSIPNTYNNAAPVSRLATANEPIPSNRPTFRSPENGINGPPPVPNSLPAKRMTLREQQVIQLRREIMHPGGVRLQLRRKDSVGSIAWVDAFGAVWVAGWKQKEHPVLYNALHIGDQLISIAGMPVNSASDANKIIRNTNTLFIEVLVRRIPFGRGYAIRRDREGQCLGLIRDENSSTIVDVIPNSLAARHGLPPKAQSCDGTTLTFWVLTEINGRPLNLFFKDNEIRDRLNSVGRDISILVQPSDLITKLKKQLKSLRGYKDYLLQ